MATIPGWLEKVSGVFSGREYPAPQKGRGGFLSEVPGGGVRTEGPSPDMREEEGHPEGSAPPLVPIYFESWRQRGQHCR